MCVYVLVARSILYSSDSSAYVWVLLGREGRLSGVCNLVSRASARASEWRVERDCAYFFHRSCRRRRRPENQPVRTRCTQEMRTATGCWCLVLSGVAIACYCVTQKCVSKTVSKLFYACGHQLF